MKHFMKKFLVSFTAVVVVAASATAYAATADGPTPRWTYMTMIRAGMDVDGKNIASISVTCDGDYAQVNKIKAKCELQQLKDSWKTIKTWTEENDGSIIMYSKSYAVAKKYSYRLKVTAYVYKDGKLLETVMQDFDCGYYQ